MAATLKIASLDGTVYVDLLAGTLKLEAESWTSRSAPVVGDYAHTTYGAQPAFTHYSPVVETMDLVGSDTGANLTAAIAALATLIASAKTWHASRHTTQSYWLYHCATGETAIRRALIYEASLQILTDHGLDPMIEEAAVRLRLTLTRHPLWEASTATVQTKEALTLWGNKYTLTTAVAGNEPARIRDLSVKPRISGGGPLYSIWIGLRDQGVSTLNFDPVYELEDGTNGASATDVIDATASQGYKVQVAFNVTPGAVSRMTLTCAQASIRYAHMNYSHQVGNYLALLRCKVTAGAKVGVQLRVAYTNSADSDPCQEQYIENSGWRLIPMGYISIPPHGYRDQLAANDNVATTQLQIWAQHLAGTAATDVLDLDAIAFIPSDHMAYLVGTDVEYRVNDDTPAHCLTFEDDTTLACGYRYGKPSLSLDGSMDKFYLPRLYSCIVVAGERETSHVLTEANDIRVEYLPRWLSYRSS